MNFCEYGCEREAKYQFKNGKWCCSKSHNSCPIEKKKNSENNKGRIVTYKTRQKIREKNKGKIISLETREKIRKSRKGKHLSDAHKSKVSSSLKTQEILDNSSYICDYGCGQQAIYIFRNGKKCCSKSHNSCPKNKKINSKINKGRIVSSETKEKIRTSIKDLNLVGSKNSNYKGALGRPLYDTYKPQLFFTDQCRRNNKEKKILEVECSVCKNFFIPSMSNVINRIGAITGIQGGEHKFYCSDECKRKCSVYGKKSYQKGHPNKLNQYYTQEEYQTFRVYVLQRDNYICQYCGEKAEHVHHERPQKLEPFFSLDLDLAWSVCRKCHYEKGHVDECSTGSLGKKFC